MDDGRFDALTRVLGAARTRRGAIGALTALFGGAAVADAEGADSSKNKHHHHRRHKKRCNPKCPAGQKCDRKTRSCFCQNGGSVCGANCCLPGTRCEGGQCTPLTPPATCHEFGTECAGDNIPCCGADLQCASGQGGKFDVACYKKADVACTADTECVYGTRCTGGKCTLIQPPPVPTCNSSNCTGCCTGDACVPIGGQGTNLCGAGGAVCGGCGAGEVCTAGACVPFICNASSCPNGCCIGNTCVAYGSQSVAACGTAGATCGACGSGLGCFNGLCVACSATTCPNGCCNGNVCVPYASQTDSLCGTAGAACAACTSPNTCNLGTGICEIAAGCDGTTCASGCCFNDTCVPYASQTGTACGTGGVACAPCVAPNLTCNTGTGACEVTGTCDGTTCATGCCTGNVCQPGTTLVACGTGGVACDVCTGTEVCDPTTRTCLAP